MNKYDDVTGQVYPGSLRVGSGSVMLTLESAPKVLFETPFVSLREVRYLDQTGARFMSRAVLIMPDDALIIPVTKEEGKLVLVNVFRPGINRFCWEFPQVRMNEGETVRDAAIRCAQKEVGLVGDPDQLEELLSFSTMPDRVTERVFPTIVDGKFDFQSRVDKGEILDGAVRSFAVYEVKDMIRSGDVQCPCVITAFYRFIDKE